MTKGEGIARRVKGYMATYGRDPKWMAAMMHVSLPTWYRKLREPSSMTVKDLEKLERITKLELLQGLQEE